MMLHLFDVDYTLVRRSTTWYFLKEAFRERILSFRQFHQLPLEWFRYKIGRVNENFIENAVKPLEGIDQRTLETLAESCFTRGIKPNLYVEGLRLINEIKGRNEKVYFATSAFYTLIAPLERFLGIDGSIASALEFDAGKTTGRVDGKALFGKSKKNAVEAWLTSRAISPDDVHFYSDSYTDLSVMEFCGHPVAVNPDPILRREAKKRGWDILRFGKLLGNTEQ
jgi:HAD superfamily hydrolase (TIGR01490 family)